MVAVKKRGVSAWETMFLRSPKKTDVSQSMLHSRDMQRTTSLSWDDANKITRQSASEHVLDSSGWPRSIDVFDIRNTPNTGQRSRCCKHLAWRSITQRSPNIKSRRTNNPVDQWSNCEATSAFSGKRLAADPYLTDDVAGIDYEKCTSPGLGLIV